MTRRGRKSSARVRRKRRKPPILLLVALGLLIAGFLVRRALVPRVTHYLAYRPPDRTNPLPAASLVPQGDRSSSPGEELTPGDRRELGHLIKERSKQ